MKSRYSEIYKVYLEIKKLKKRYIQVINNSLKEQKLCQS